MDMGIRQRFTKAKYIDVVHHQATVEILCRNIDITGCIVWTLRSFRELAKGVRFAWDHFRLSYFPSDERSVALATAKTSYLSLLKKKNDPANSPSSRSLCCNPCHSLTFSFRLFGVQSSIFQWDIVRMALDFFYE